MRNITKRALVTVELESGKRAFYGKAYSGRTMTAFDRFTRSAFKRHPDAVRVSVRAMP